MPRALRTRSNSEAPAKIPVVTEPRSRSKTGRADLSKIVSKPRGRSKAGKADLTVIVTNGLKIAADPDLADSSDEEAPLVKIQGKKTKAAPKTAVKVRAVKVAKVADQTFVVDNSDSPEKAPAVPMKAPRARAKVTTKKDVGNGVETNADLTAATGARRKNKSAAVSVSKLSPEEAEGSPEPVKTTKRDKNREPVSSDESENEELLRSPANKSKRTSPAIESKNVKKMTTTRKKTKPQPSEDPKSMEESNDEMDPEPTNDPPKRGRRNQAVPPEPCESQETTPVPAEVNPVKRGRKNVKKPEGEIEQLIPMLMDQLQLASPDDQGAKKVVKKKAAARPKGKAAAKKTKKVRNADSDPETSMMKFSSVDSIKNITVSRGTTVKSLSEDNLHTLSLAQLDKPRRIAARKFVLSSPEQPIEALFESDSEEERKTKKTRATRRKPAK